MLGGVEDLGILTISIMASALFLVGVNRINAHEVDSPNLTGIVIFKIHRDCNVSRNLGVFRRHNAHMIDIRQVTAFVGAGNSNSHAIRELGCCRVNILVHRQIDTNVGNIANIQY